jgi:NADH-quinone oxidoreductase subunit E
MTSPKSCRIAGTLASHSAYPSAPTRRTRSRHVAADTPRSVWEDSEVEVVLFIVGLVIGVLIGWFVWNRVGAKKLNEDFARRLRHTDDQIVTLRRRAEDAEGQLEPLHAQIREVKDERKETLKQLEKLKGRFDKLKAEKDEIEASMAAVRKRADEADRLAAEVDDERRKAAAARSEADELRLQLSSVDELRNRLTSAQDRLVEAERAKEDARLRAAEAEKVTKRATLELEASMDTIATLREAAERTLDLQYELDASQARVSELDATVGRQSSELIALREQLAASSVVADERGSAAVEPEAVEVSEVASVAPALANPGPAPEEEPASQEEPASDEGSAPFEPVEHIAIDTESETASEVAGSPEPVSDRDAAVERVRAIASRTAGGREVTNDDLKKIHGIGPKIEKLLKGMGITSFLQVANFTPEDIEAVTLALDAFPGRIERDDWVGSADQLYRDKYEED